MNGYGYDAFGRIKNHRWKASGGTLLAGWSYDFDRIGNKKYQEDLQSATQSELYGYDDVYRVTGFKQGQLNEQKTDITSPSRTQTWTLDPLGNWDDTVLDSVTETRTHNSVNELTARTIGEDPEIDLSYDAAGNLTQDGDSNGDHKYTWDYRNRLIEVQEKQSGNWNTTGEYKHDAQNRRVLKTVTNKGGLNGTTRFLWGGEGHWQCLEERDGSGDVVARYTYAPGYIDAVAVQERDLNSDDDFGDANEVVYYHQNTLFTVYALSDATESAVERYRYDAYGACTVLDADGSVDADGLSDVANPYTFTGRRLDPESGLMQYRNRYYHTGLGRFISRDPEGYGDGYGLYGYVLCGPVCRTDPTGAYKVGYLEFFLVPDMDRIEGLINSNVSLPDEDKAKAIAFVHTIPQRMVYINTRTKKACSAAEKTELYERIKTLELDAAVCLLRWGSGQTRSLLILMGGTAITACATKVHPYVAGGCAVVTVVVTVVDYYSSYRDFQKCLDDAVEKFDSGG